APSEIKSGIVSFNTLQVTVTNLNVMNITSSSAAVMAFFSTPISSPISGYFVYSTDPNLVQGAATQRTGTQSFMGSQYSMALTGLKPATDYFVQVVIVKSPTELKSKTFRFTTLPPPPPTTSKFVNVLAQNITSSSAT